VGSRERSDVTTGFYVKNARKAFCRFVCF